MAIENILAGEERTLASEAARAKIRLGAARAKKFHAVSAGFCNEI